jgi:hypothetical protein
MNLNKIFLHALIALLLLQNSLLASESLSSNTAIPGLLFISSPADGPSFSEGPHAQSRHMGNDNGEQQYGLRFYLSVTDPQGFSDIASVIVTGPTGIQYIITDPEKDGWYDLWTGELTSPPALGTYTFRITDLAGNWIEATDNVTAVIDYPRNIIPRRNSVVSSSTPQFTWDAVAGAARYHVQVTNSNGGIIWDMDNLTSTTVKYNDNGSASESLLNGSVYNWGIYCTDADGNRGEQYFWISFLYSTSPVSPVITNPSVKSAHYGKDSGGEEYVLAMNIQAWDPQGLADIATIKVTGTGGTLYQLYDNNNDGNFDGWFSGLTSPPQAGSYIFRATDKSGNWAEKVEVMTGYVDYPKNVHPIENEVVSTSAPVFSWDIVSGAVRYEVWVSDNSGRTIWGKNDFSGSAASFVYNDNGTALEPLKDGGIYTWTIKAVDINGNWGEQSGTRFAYSTSTAKPVIGNHDATTHINADILENEDRGYDFWLDVIDPQGLADIASVTVLTPGGITYTLTDPENDGRYNLSPGGIQSPYPIGQCQFTVTDKSANTSTVHDTLYAWVQYPRNIKPVNNELLTTAPVFSWDAVSGISYYQIHVWKQNGPIIWGGVNVYNNTSAVYNFNGTGQALQEGNRYGWDIRTYDSKGNVGYHYGGEFIYSSSTSIPILSNIRAYTAHYGADTGEQSYFLSLSVQIADPQGLSDISSVTVTGPDLKTYLLTDNNSDGVYDSWTGGTTVAPATGTYVFKAVDNSGNWKESTVTVAAVLDYPKKLKPLQNEVVTTSQPVFSWDPIPGADYYRVWVNKLNGIGVWNAGDITTSSVTYNYNNTASISLQEGHGYSLNVQGYDTDGNFGEQSNRIFFYSTNTTNPILSGYQVSSRHWADGNFSETWGINLTTLVTDPQGLSDIDSVWVKKPDGIIIKLYDDNTNGDHFANDGGYNYDMGGFTSPLVLGEYLFNAVDKSGHLVTFKDTLTQILDYPHNNNILNNSIVTDPDFTISWDKVSGATSYEVWIHELNWSSSPWHNPGRLTETSVKYNFDGSGTDLKEGDVYYLSINAYDNEGNIGQNAFVKFAFRPGSNRTIYVDTTNTSGTENGTSEYPYNTIKEAVDRTITSDTVLVSPGVYEGGIDNITSISLIGSDPMNTIINGYLSVRSKNVLIKGFRISNSDRSGIEINENASAEITNNIISENYWSGISAGWGRSAYSVIRNNTIVNNGLDGINLAQPGSGATITNNIIAFNMNEGIYNGPECTVKNSFNNYYGNLNNFTGFEKGLGDTIAYPKFKDYPKKDYSLTSGSPCLDSSDPDTDGDGINWSEDIDDIDPDTTRMDKGAVFLDQRLLIPATPVKLTAVSCNDLVTLKWNKVTGPYFMRYRIYGGLSSDPVTPVDSTSNSISDTTKVITGLIHGQNYYFRVAAVNRGGKTGDYSYQSSVKVQTGVIPKIKSKWSGDVLICYNQGDSISQYQWYKGGALIPGATDQYLVAKKQGGIYSIQTIDKNGCKNISLPLTVGGTQTITAWPNPASVSFALRVTDLPEGRATVSIISSGGRKVMEFQAENNNGEILREVQVSGLEIGVYYIYITDSKKESYSTKLVISK